MRAKHTALILTAGFLLIPTLTWSQGPGGQPDRGFGGGQGGDRGGFNNGQWGGAPWAGQKGGGPGEKGGGPGPMPPGGGQWGGPGGGGGGDPGGGGTRPAMRGDPDQFFNMFSRGKDVIRVDELDPSTKSFFDRIASRFGLTGNEISRDQFKGAMTKVREAMANGQFGPQGGPGGMGQGSMDPDRRAEDSFQRRDKNQNGVLEFDEMPQSLQDERDKYDTNHDGVIDLNEYKAFLAARRGDRGQDGNDPTANPRRRRMDEEPEMEPEQPERKRPQVVRAGNMPKDFPFADLDRDGDGQIGLYEWKDAGRPIAQFLEMDLNNDGFLTVDEYYHWKRRGEELAAKSGNQPNQLARGMGRGMGMNPGMMAFGGGMTGGRGGMMGGGGGNPWAGGGMGMGMGGGNPWGGWGGGRGGFGGGGPGMNFRMGDPSGGGFGDNGGFRGFRGPGGDATATPGGFGGGAQPGMGFPGGGPGGFRGLGGPGNGFGGGGGQDTGTGFGGGPGRNRAPGGFGPPDANTDDRSADRGPGGRGPGGRRGFGGDNSDNGGGRGPGGRRGFGGDNGGDQGPGGFGGRRGGRGPSN